MESTLFPDTMAVVIDYLETKISVRTSADVPEDLTIPALVVQEVGGEDDSITDSTSLDVSAFAPTYAAARSLAEQARLALAQVAGRWSPLIDHVETVTRPTRRDYENPGVERIVATYRVTARRIR